ncbi:MAG: hypothetical protein ABSD74_11315 [Rhizomicrobium sp.]|jgi:membrane protein YqaA with SNARE-associated domain
MAGCEVNPDPANWEGLIFGSAGAGAAAAGGVVAIDAAIEGALTGAGGIAALAIILAAVTGAILGGFISYAIYYFNRLFVQDPSTITLGGCVYCAGINSGLPPVFADFDWTFNLGGPSFVLMSPIVSGLALSDIETRGAPGSGVATAFVTQDPSTEQTVLHCEITSEIGACSAVGTAVGAGAGTVAGIVAGAIACAALGLVTFGIGAALCLFILALAALIGCVVGAIVGDAVGSLVGWIADQFDDYNQVGDSVTMGCVMSFTGRWVTDAGHSHNEIHDVASAKIIECIECQTDATGATAQGLIAAVGIGRHPSGRDP